MTVMMGGGGAGRDSIGTRMLPNILHAWDSPSQQNDLIQMSTVRLRNPVLKDHMNISITFGIYGNNNFDSYNLNIKSQEVPRD